MADEQRAWTTLVADPDDGSREALQALVRHDPGLELVAQCSTAEETIRAIQRRRPDLAFLAVELPGRDAFAVLEALRAHELPMVVFVCARRRELLRSFDTYAVDYLVRPLDDKRFTDAVSYAKRALAADRRLDSVRRLVDLLAALRRRR